MQHSQFNVDNCRHKATSQAVHAEDRSCQVSLRWLVFSTCELLCVDCSLIDIIRDVEACVLEHAVSIGTVFKTTKQEMFGTGSGTRRLEGYFLVVIYSAHCITNHTFTIISIA